MEITKEDLLILQKYYDKMFQIAVNNSCSTLSAEMKRSILNILEKYDRIAGCSTCNSNLPRLMLEGCRMYKENEKKLRNTEIKEDNNKKDKKQKNAK